MSIWWAAVEIAERLGGASATTPGASFSLSLVASRSHSWRGRRPGRGRTPLGEAGAGALSPARPGVPRT
jgi:hypothetical protein